MRGSLSATPARREKAKARLKAALTLFCAVSVWVWARAGRTEQRLNDLLDIELSASGTVCVVRSCQARNRCRNYLSKERAFHTIWAGRSEVEVSRHIPMTVCSVLGITLLLATGGGGQEVPGGVPLNGVETLGRTVASVTPTTSSPQATTTLGPNAPAGPSRPAVSATSNITMSAPGSVDPQGAGEPSGASTTAGPTRSATSGPVNESFLAQASSTIAESTSVAVLLSSSPTNTTQARSPTPSPTGSVPPAVSAEPS
jgi:hypothetical protein